MDSPLLSSRTARLILAVSLAILNLRSASAAGEPALKAAAEALHREAIVVEGHVHMINSVLVQGLDPWKVQATGLFDYARARQGGVDVVIEHLYVEDRYNHYNYTVKQACRLIETFHRVLDANRDKMDLALTSADVRRIVQEGKLAVILALEGGFDTEGDLDVLRLFYRLGVRMVQLSSHDTTNVMVDAYAGEQKWNGLSDYGRTVIREMNRLGIVIDISHTPDHAKRQIIEASRAPVVSSHNGLAHFAKVIGNLSDETLSLLAKRGGVVGMHSAGWLISQRGADWTLQDAIRQKSLPGANPANLTLPRVERTPEVDYGQYIKSLDRRMYDRWTLKWGYGRPWREAHNEAIALGAPLPTVDEWAEQIEFVTKFVGSEHAGLGLDMMAGGLWLKDFDATSYPRLTEALIARGLPRDTILKVLGENWLRILDRARVP